MGWTPERFERIFDKFIKQCEKNGLLEGKLKAIDATHIIVDVAIPNTANLLKEGGGRILRQLEKEKKELDESLKRYLPEKGPPQKLTKEKLSKELALSKELIEEVQGKYSSKVEKIAHLLEQVIDPTEKRELVSFIDPDARFGRKSKDKKFAGCKAHVVEDESCQII